MRPIYEWRGYLVRMLKFTSRLAFTTCQSCQHDNFGMLTKLFHVTLSWSDKVTSCLTRTRSHFHDMHALSFSHRIFMICPLLFTTKTSAAMNAAGLTRRDSGLRTARECCPRCSRWSWPVVATATWAVAICRRRTALPGWWAASPWSSYGRRLWRWVLSFDIQSWVPSLGWCSLNELVLTR